MLDGMNLFTGASRLYPNVSTLTKYESRSNIDNCCLKGMNIDRARSELFQKSIGLFSNDKLRGGLGGTSRSPFILEKDTMNATPINFN